MISYALTTAMDSGIFDRIVVVAPRERWDAITGLVSPWLASSGEKLRLVEGGAHRQEFVLTGLRECPGVAHVCVHDAARPFAVRN